MGKWSCKPWLMSANCFGVKDEKSTNIMESYHRMPAHHVGGNGGVLCHLTVLFKEQLAETNEV